MIDSVASSFGWGGGVPSGEARATGLPTMGESGWFGVLLDEAVARAMHPVLPVTVTTPAGLRDELRDVLWEGGLALGAPFEGRASPVLGRSAPEQAHVELLRCALAAAGQFLQWRVRPAGASLRLAIASVAGAAAGELSTARTLWRASGFAPEQDKLTERQERRLLGIVGARLARRGYLLGDPSDGLPLHAGLAALELRHLVRVAFAVGRGQRGVRRVASKFLAVEGQARITLLEALASLAEAGGLADTAQRRTVLRQVRSLPLAAADRRRAQRVLQAPPPLVDVLAKAPGSLKEALLEQLFCAVVSRNSWPDALRSTVRQAALAAGIAEATVRSAEARIAAAVLAHHDALAKLVLAPETAPLQDALESAVDALRLAAAGVAHEAQETGELGVLLARAARRETLTSEERHRMREQLVDLAKVVPSLAILAAPGGTLLLPIMLKLLPFDLRPSAFQPARRAVPEPKRLPASRTPETG